MPTRWNVGRTRGRRRAPRAHHHDYIVSDQVNGELWRIAPRR